MTKDERSKTETQKIRDDVHADTCLRGNRAFNRLLIKYHGLVFYPHNGNWITHGRPLTIIGERHTPCVLKRWDSMLSGLIFLTNLSMCEYTLTERTMVYLIAVTLTPHPHPPPPNLLISLLPAPHLNVTRTIWRGLKT